MLGVFGSGRRRLRLDDAEGRIVEMGDEKPKRYAVVRLDNAGPLFLILKDYGEPGQPVEASRYYYQEHICGSDVLRAEVVCNDRSADPHGIVTFLGHLPDGWMPPEDGPPADDGELLAEVRRLDDAWRCPVCGKGVERCDGIAMGRAGGCR